MFARTALEKNEGEKKSKGVKVCTINELVKESLTKMCFENCPERSVEAIHSVI